MAVQHPYISGAGSLRQAISKFRSTIPPKLDSAVLQKLGLASNNESYLINILKFIKVIDENGDFSAKAKSIFTSHKDDEFAEEFGKIVRSAYDDLFALHGDNSWTLPNDELVNFFRKSNQSSDVVGSRQAKTFETLASLSGKRDFDDSASAQKVPTRPRRRERLAGRAHERVSEKRGAAAAVPAVDTGREHSVGLTVRLELNLPANATKEDYDNIFKSIRENLLNA
ncbi:MAG: DUF5343 domain-containing protein [Rhodomicrobiaceae bacterium]